MYISRDRLWRIDQAPAEIRVYSRTQPTAMWMLRTICRSAAELEQWLRREDDPAGWLAD